jgi:uncharacterized protein
MIDFFLIVTLGFLGSFGHCLGMCGPLTVAFSLSDRPQSHQTTWVTKLQFHLLLNLGRLISYSLVGLAIGSLGSLLIAGGQLAGIGSDLRRGLAIVTGMMLIWFGLTQLQPKWLPNLPMLHPVLGKLHDRLSQLMLQLANISPIALGLLWGLMPCGFLYAAQIKAAETGEPQQAALTMFAFGLGTLPMMLGVGSSTAWLSRDRRSQLFRLGGWVTLAIGILTLTRNSEMVDYTGHFALILLMLALVARPISRLWPGLLQYRRALGVGAFFLAIAHTTHTLAHNFEWNITAIQFMLPAQRWGLIAGIAALFCLLFPAATSFDRLMQKLGQRWRSIHLLSLPALGLTVFHALLLGSSYFGALTLTPWHWIRVIILILALLLVFALRSRSIWQLFNQLDLYASPKK